MVTEWLHPLLRLVAAALAGGLIGWERQLRGRPAGLRTHVLVSLGAAIVLGTIEGASLDALSHVIQGVATGIGFLGAGEILHHTNHGGEKVSGLTSAASLWVTAGLGMAAAMERWPLVVLGTLTTLLTLTILSGLEKTKGTSPQGPSDVRSDDPPGR